MPIKIVPTKLGRKMIKRLNEKRGISNEPEKEKKPKQKKDKEKKNKEKKTKLTDFEREILDAYTKHMPKNSPEKYQRTDVQSIVIYDDASTEIFRCKGAIPKKKLNKIASRYPNAIVMVEIGVGLTKLVPIKTFKKLIDIKFIMFEREYELFGIEDSWPSKSKGQWFTPDKVVDYIYSINHLLKTFVIEEAFDKANAVYLSARFYDLAGVDKTCKILYRSGQTDKLSLKDFLIKYKLDAGIGPFQPVKVQRKFKEKSKKKGKKKKR